MYVVNHTLAKFYTYFQQGLRLLGREIGGQMVLGGPKKREVLFHYNRSAVLLTSYNAVDISQQNFLFFFFMFISAAKCTVI